MVWWEFWMVFHGHGYESLLGLSTLRSHIICSNSLLSLESKDHWLFLAGEILRKGDLKKRTGEIHLIPMNAARYDPTAPCR